MRLFVAILLSDEVKDALCRAEDTLGSMSAYMRPTARENLHLTLAFIGETERERDARAAVEAVNAKAFTLKIEKTGRFRRDGGDLWWAGAAKTPELLDTQRRVAAELAARGFKLESREFSPHLTLGREVLAAPDFDRAKLDEALGRPEMEAARVSLMKSERAGGGFVYTEIYGKDLTKG